MKRAAALSLAALLTGCEAHDAHDELPPEVEAAAKAVNDADQSLAWTAEVISYADAVTSPPAAPCPAVARSGGLSEFTVVVDYGEGCSPTSGIAETVSGSFTLDYAAGALTVSFDDLTADGRSIDGYVAGSYAAVDRGGVDLALESDLVFDAEAGEVWTRHEADVGLTLDDVTVDGAWSLLSPEVEADTLAEGIAFHAEDLVGDCPLPYAGTYTVTMDGETVSVAFDEDSPQDGTAAVSYRGRTYEVNLCELAGAL